MAIPGRHGSMTSSQLESLILRNSDFLAVVRAGDGEGRAGLYESVSGEYIHPIQGGVLPEYSRHNEPDYDCACTPGGICRSSAHGIKLVLGWRNILFALLVKRKVRPTNEIRRILGSEETIRAYDYGYISAPQTDPAPAWVYSGIRT